MQVRIFCSESVENLITDEIEFLAFHLESHDTEDLPPRLVVYNFDENLIKELNEFESKVNGFKFEDNETNEFFTTIHPPQTVESITDKFLLFILKSLNGYEIKFEAENDHDVIEIQIS